MAGDQPWKSQDTQPEYLRQSLAKRQKAYAPLLDAIATLATDAAVECIQVEDGGITLRLYDRGGNGLSETIGIINLLTDDQVTQKRQELEEKEQSDFTQKILGVRAEGGTVVEDGLLLRVGVRP